MRFPAIIACAVVLATTASAQVIGIDDLVPTTGTSNTIPWGQTGGYTSLHVYTAAALLSRGVCAGAVLTDVAVAPSSGTSGTYNAPTAEMKIGHLSVSPPVAGAWTTHLASPIIVHGLASGPYTFPWTLNTYASLPGFAAAGFVWDGIRDIGIQYTSSASTTGTFSARRSATQLRHGVNVFNAVANAPTTNGLFAMEVRLTFTPGAAAYDTNTAGASLDANGLQGGICAAANTVLCAGAPVTVSLASNQLGLGFDLAYNLAGLVPLGGGGFAAGTQGIVNLDLSGGLFFLNGGLTALLVPNPGLVQLPFAMPLLPAPGISAQMFQISAASPDGFELSQGINLVGIGAGAGAPGPVGDDAATIFTAGAAPYCMPPVTMYGTTYTQFGVVTNGRVTMGGTANTSFTSAATYAASEPAFAGCHGDFNQAVAGSILVVNNGGNLQVQYNGIGYFGGTALNTSTWQMDFIAGNVTFSNLTMGVPTAARNVFIGVHPGGAATIEAGFPTSYVGAGGFISSLAGNSHGVFGDLFVGALTDPAEILSFTYNGAGGYNVAY